MKSILQTPLQPTQILHGLADLADSDVTRFRAAVAYVMTSGLRELFPRLASAVGEGKWNEIPKIALTSFDFGHTDPGALRELIKLGWEVRIPRANFSDNKVVLLANRSSFHPKLFLFDSGNSRRVMLGSANLSGRAMTNNTEACVTWEDPSPNQLDQWWEDLVADTLVLNPEIVNLYAEARAARTKPIEPDPPLTPIGPEDPEFVPSFSEAMADGDLDPAEYAQFWVEAGFMSGGSENQLELPRGANRYFGFEFTSYGNDHAVIGHPVLRAPPDREWSDRPVTWHGNNRMERINLPTAFQGGFEYPGTAILFTRADHETFVIEVAPWGSETAKAWRNASAEQQAIFSVGRTNRICGVF